MRTTKEPTNAMALRYAMKCDFPELREHARRIVVEAFKRADYNVTHAARRLRIGRNAMSRFVQEVGL